MLEYEFSKYSQNGEDGIILEAVKYLKKQKNTFFEIGYADGTCNCSRILAENNWSGLGIDLYDERDVKSFKNVNYKKLLVTPDNCLDILPKEKINFFSLDIDSYDYEIAKKYLENNFKPSFVCLEINKRFGNKTVASFPYAKKQKKKLYHKFRVSGVSIMKYKHLWESYGYKFFGYDSSCVNTFFYYPQDFSTEIGSVNINSIDEFPVKNDEEILENINNHWYWHDKKHLIYG